MKTVYNQEGFNVDGFYWRSMGWYGEILEGETRETATERLQKEMRDYLVKCHPNAPLQAWQVDMQNQRHEPTTIPTLKVEREPGDAILEGINAADSWDGVKGLKSYQYLVKNNQTWLEAFNNQKTKLGGIIG
jgi:hypothetical protein